jgi:methionyl-tRNA formyltransferase
MRIFIAGQKAFGVEVYKLCVARGHEIAGVSAPRLAGDGDKPDRLRAAAEKDGVPWIEAGKLNADSLPDGVDLICAAHSHDFIGRKTRERARLGAIGYHPSLLPLHRGRDAIVWTLHMGEKVTGGTIYWMNDIMDGGDIAAQEHIFVPPGATAGDLWRDQLFPLGLKLYERVLEDLERGIIVRQPQNHDLATWEPSWDRPPLKRPDPEG